MSDLIGRSDVIELCADAQGRASTKAELKGISKVWQGLLKLPSAEAGRPTGEWVSNHDGTWNCSECGLRVFVYAKGNFCPNCGADMRHKGSDGE